MNMGARSVMLTAVRVVFTGIREPCTLQWHT